jgi:RNA polymerase sigma factor (sigma-70 family)
MSISFSEKTIFLTAQEEQQALKLWQTENDPQALCLILKSYYPLIVGKAKKFFNYTQQKDDLISAGVEGFLVAVNRFENMFNARLGTYASLWIELFMKEFIIESQSITSTSSLKRKFFFKWMHLKNRWLDRVPTADECAQELGISLKQAEDLHSEFSHALSLNSFEEGCSADVLPFYEEEDLLIESADWQRYQSLFTKAFESCLTEKEKEILTYRLYHEEISLKDLAEKCSLSTERIRQIEKKSIEKIKKRIAMMQSKLHA